MLWVFLIISQYFIFLQSLLFPLISGLFRVLVHWDLLVHWQTWTRKKKEKKRKSRILYCILILPEHSALTLRKWEKKRESEKEKGTGRDEGKRKILIKKENTGNCPFENIGFYLVIFEVVKNPVFMQVYAISKGDLIAKW